LIGDSLKSRVSMFSIRFRRASTRLASTTFPDLGTG
jgi:hypothetical protein